MKQLSQNLEFQRQAGATLAQCTRNNRYSRTIDEQQQASEVDRSRELKKHGSKATRAVDSDRSLNEVQLRMDKVSRLFHNNNEMSLSIKEDYA